MLGDAVLSLDALIAQVKPRPVGSAAVKRQAHGLAPHPAATHAESTDGLLSSLSVFQALRAATPANTILIEESPSNLAELHSAWPVDQPDSFYTFASGSLGWNLPASIGIALAERDSGRNRPVLAIIGDGSFQYSIQGLWTAVQHELPILFVVPRNGQYGILKSFAVLEQTPNVPGLDLPGLDFVALAQGYGAHGVRATTLDEIRKACSEAFTRNVPTVLEVPVQATIPPLL